MTAPEAPHGAVTVLSPSLTVSTNRGGSITWLSFDVPLRLENDGAVPLTFVTCASRVEFSVGNGWTPAWSPYCAAGGNAQIVLAAGEHRELSARVTAAVEGPGGPKWVPGTTAGNYRFLVGVETPGFSGELPLLASNTFTLAAEP